MLTRSESETVKTALAEVLATPAQLIWDKRLSDIFWVNSVAISRDGSRIVAGTFVHDYRHKSDKFLPNAQARFGTYCFSNSSATPMWSDEFLAWDGVFGVAVSADGAVAAASGWLDRTESMGQGFVRAYNAADGTKLLDFSNMTHRASWVSLSGDGAVLAAVGDDVYVFRRDGAAAFNPMPVKLGIADTAKEYVTNVAVHPSGTWLAACDHSGHVYLATLSDKGVETKVWDAQAKIPFLSVAIAAASNTFVVGGGNDVFLFNRDRFEDGPIRYDTTRLEDAETIPPDKADGPQENVRWVATSEHGSLITAVANRQNGKERTGVVIALRPQNGELTRIWRNELPRNPNSTSIDAGGNYVTVADGYPTITPSKFHLFDAKDGRLVWDFPTFSMNWPMAISASGNAIAAGGDDGKVYYFKP